ncbi:MAG: hypothetical protein CL675_03525 [Bdellovibrionaceae bacterium]|nr:hypothetical protein [Pseudobdellovibrionaceae bacterium]|tara:strand:+ start:106 stop:498 length:393 start_codon:yes stop_codon:yes gene_type:complete
MTTKSPPLILAVDDSAKMHKILQAKLKSEIAADKIRLQFFADPNTCLKFIKDNKDQQNMILLLSDISMPSLDGFTFLHVARNELPDIQFVVTSAHDSSDFREQAKQLGVKAYLTKPLNFEVIKELINEAA